MKTTTVLFCWFIIIYVFTISCKHTPETKPDPPTPSPPVVCDPDTVYFTNAILPMINSSCAKSGCHDAVSHQDGVILIDYTSIIINGEIEAYNPGDSKLYEVITENDPDKIMPPPPTNPLSSSQISQIFQWISQGAKNNACNETVCDSVNVTYSLTINPLMTNYCSGCHNSVTASANINLSNHPGVVAAIDGGRFMGAVLQEPGFIPMPQNSNRLTECNIGKLRKWIVDGKPNNK